MRHFLLSEQAVSAFYYLDDWLILAHSWDVLIGHTDALLSHLESLYAVCGYAEEHVHPQAVFNISGCV